MSGKNSNNTEAPMTSLRCIKCKSIGHNRLFNYLGKPGEGTYNKCLNCVVSLSKEVNTDSNKDDWIECRICNYRAKEIAVHVKNFHGILPKDYGITKCENSKKRMRGENNPGYQHGGKLSPWSKKSKFYNEESHKSAINNSQEGIEKNSPVRRGFYKTDDEFNAAQKRDVAFFIDKYGVEEGSKRHQEKTNKWIRSYKKQNYSKISQELFVEIEKCYSGDTYFATKQREDMSKYINKEFRTEIGILPDYIDVNTKRIIEFDGDYWHGKVGNKQREAIRDAKLVDAGYTILHIKESDFKNDKDKVIKECIDFLMK